MSGRESEPCTAPAPWKLRGWAVLCFCLFRPSAAATPPSPLFHYPAFGFLGRIGVLAAVQYHESPVGAYDEVFASPGTVLTAAMRPWTASQTITRMYVTSPHSAVCGRGNWGLPKMTADIAVQAGRRDRKSRPRDVTASLALGSRQAWKLRIRPFGPAIPAATNALGIRLAQAVFGGILITPILAFGRIRLARLRELRSFWPAMPARSRIAPFLCLYVPRFRLYFPKPRYRALRQAR